MFRTPIYGCVQNMPDVLCLNGRVKPKTPKTMSRYCENTPR
ncbi:hypothetical protein D918_07495, partial [Trichuris suis]